MLLDIYVYLLRSRFGKMQSRQICLLNIASIISLNFRRPFETYRYFVGTWCTNMKIQANKQESDLSSHSHILTHTHLRTLCSTYKHTQICVLENRSSGVNNIDVLIYSHVAVNQWLQRFFLFVGFPVVANVAICWTVETWVNEYTFIGCMCPLPWPTYYFPKAFWNNHVTVNKTVIQTAADEYHLHAPRGRSNTGENK